jgi:hypothetical protein
MFSITISISLDGPRYSATGSANSLPRIIRVWNAAQAMYPNITGDIRLKDIINGTK